VKDDYDLTRLVEVGTDEQVATIRELFREYADSLNIDLSFQGFETELAELPGQYAPPGGHLFLAVHGEDTAGCVGLRPTGDGICEMKRLYVRPRFRGKQVGRTLAQAVIAAARRLGYSKMRLDSLSSLKAAISLYESLGFTLIPPYYANPNDGVIYMELKL
jgi:ribosomal protein S18 acetylase RimI-like enzyme